MKISVFRHTGFLKNAYGVNLPLAIFLNGEQIGSVKKREITTLDIPNSGGCLHVGEDNQIPWRKATLDQCITRSAGVKITSDQEGQCFECGTNWWVAFDVLNFKYFKAFGRNVFFLRRQGDGCNGDDHTAPD